MNNTHYRTGYPGLFLLALACFLIGSIPGVAQFSVDVEGGVALPAYNDIRVPRDGGDDISFTEDLQRSVGVAVRARLSYTIAERHTISALVAPLEFSSSGTLDRPVRFNGETFPAGVPLEGEYTFNSYRLTYRYTFINDSSFQLGLGLTGKVRDASITIATPIDTLPGEQRRISTKTNFGFVPLVNVNAVWRAIDRGGLLLDADALVGPVGRAEDAQLAFWYDVAPNTRLRLGYRILEGGADVDEVYNFTLINYAMLGVTVTFK